MGWFSDVVSDPGRLAAGLVTGGGSELWNAGANLPGVKKLLNGPEAPPPPDVAARDAASLAAAQSTANINNPNIINQFGNQKYTPGIGGQPGTIEQTLSPEQKALYKSNTANQQSSADIYGQGLNRFAGNLGSEFDISGAPAAPGSYDQTRQKVMDAMLARSGNRLNQANETQDANLIASGIRPGTEAWSRAKAEQGQNRNDAISQAELAGGNAAAQAHGLDADNRRNYIAEMLQKRQTPLNEINSFKTGAQQNPFAGQGYQGGATVRDNGGLLDQYNTNIYNQQNAGNNATKSGLFGLGAAFIGG